MRDALHAAGRPMVFSLCEWGQNKPWEWAGDVGHMWRTTGDIYSSYDGRKGWESGWKRNLDLQYSLVESNGPDGIGKYAGPGHWNDPDMLEVGTEGLTYAESRAHFSLWCIIAAPLIAGNDVRHMKPEYRDMMTNKDVLSIDQDALGKQGFRALADPGKNIEIWVKELSNGEWAVCALNTNCRRRRYHRGVAPALDHPRLHSRFTMSGRTRLPATTANQRPSISTRTTWRSTGSSR